MTKKGRGAVVDEIQYERWFLVQCLARNEEFLAMRERYKWLSTWGVPRTYFGWDPTEQQKTDMETELRELEQRARRQFAVNLSLAAEQWSKLPPDDPTFGALDSDDSILLLWPKTLGKPHSDHIDLPAWMRQATANWPGAAERRRDRLLQYIDGGRYLYVAVSVVHPAARLQHDFQRIVKQLSDLRKRGRVATLKDRPSRGLWLTFLKVWDLRTSGRTNAEVAREVLGHIYRRDKVEARRLADYYYAQAKYWVSLAWMHPVHRGTPAPGATD